MDIDIVSSSQSGSESEIFDESISEAVSLTKMYTSPGTEVAAGRGAAIESDLMEDGLKIVHLTDECLEKIFRYLNLRDLVCLAEANVRLAATAKLIFAQAHQNHRLYLKSRSDVIQIPEWHPLVDTDHFILQISVCENMFKHFGKYMRRIKIFHALSGFKTPPNYNLIGLVTKYCRLRLEELELFGATVFSVMRCQPKPFKRLERLVFSEIVTRFSPVEHLREMFPKLHTLEFYNVFHVFESFRLEQNFPHLKYFTIYTFPYAKFERSHIPIIQRIVNLNPQLKGLGVYDMKLALNEFSLETMPNIERLEIGGRLMFPRTPFDFANVRSLRIIYSNENESNIIEWRNLPTQLERLEIIGFEINDRTINLVQQVKNLKSLTVMSFDEMDLNLVRKLAEKLPHIEDVEFISKFKESSKISNAFAATLIFVQTCSTLRKATSTIQIDQTEARYIINKWHFTKSKEYLELYRKELEKVLALNWWRYSIRSNVNIIDFLKGWQRGTCFSATIVNNYAQ